MLPLEIIPKGRDEKAKKAYLFYRWFIKQNRQSIEAHLKEMATGFILTGEYRGWKTKLGKTYDE